MIDMFGQFTCVQKMYSKFQDRNSGFIELFRKETHVYCKVL